MEARSVWRIHRGTTADGLTFGNIEQVFESEPGPWAKHTTIAYNPDAGEFLALKLKNHPTGFDVMSYFSEDGQLCREGPENPVYADGDSLGAFWCPESGRYICINKTYNFVKKHIPDYGYLRKIDGRHVQSRRACSLRWSRDGCRWEPSDRTYEITGTPLPEGFLLMPDGDDPPDIEFYCGMGFWYHDRCFLMMLNYAATPLTPGKHGPHLDSEWWISRDGLRWERPYRHINAIAEMPQGIGIITHNPMLIDGKILFHFWQSTSWDGSGPAQLCRRSGKRGILYYRFPHA